MKSRVTEVLCCALCGIYRYRVVCIGREIFFRFIADVADGGVGGDIF